MNRQFANAYLHVTRTKSSRRGTHVNRIIVHCYMICIREMTRLGASHACDSD